MVRFLLALIAAALFAGAALYVSLVDHPARMRLDDEAARAHLRASLARAAPLQGGLAMLSFLLGMWSWWKEGNPWLLAGALLAIASLPLTLIVIQPLNRRLLEGPVGETKALLGRWGRLHALRTLFGLAAVLAYLAVVVRP
jgi:hypothetical protein